MRIAVMAAGAVGGYYGGRMAAAGHDVTFIARGAHRDAIRRDGRDRSERSTWSCSP
jgi:2-dehydropantoate 2-reductase